MGADDWDPSSFINGEVPVWNSTTGKFEGGALSGTYAPISYVDAQNVIDRAYTDTRETAIRGYVDTQDNLNVLLAGRNGGQVVNGGVAAGENLTLHSTAHATKGSILFGAGAYDEVNNRLGINTSAPTARVHIAGDASVPAWTTTGPIFNSADAVYTDNTTASGTVALRVGSSIRRPTFAAANPITITDAINLYISNDALAGSNVTITNAWALWVNSGAVRLAGGNGTLLYLGASGGATNRSTIRFATGGYGAPITPAVGPIFSNGEKLNFYDDGTVKLAIGMSPTNSMWFQTHGGSTGFEYHIGSTAAAPVLKAKLDVNGQWQLPQTGVTGGLLIGGDATIYRYLANALATSGQIYIPVAATATANYGSFNTGAGPFNGVTGGFFTGNAQGTQIAVNGASTFTGNLIDLQLAGAKRFMVDYTGKVGIQRIPVTYDLELPATIGVYSSGAQINGVAASDVATAIDLNTLGVSTATARIGLHRTTNSTGIVSVDIFEGRNTTNIQHRLVGSGSITSYLCAQNGGVSVGRNATPGNIFDYYGGLRVRRALSEPGAPTLVVVGTPGTTTVTYYIVAEDRFGWKTQISAPTTINNAPDVLSVNDYVQINWVAVTGPVAKYYVLKNATSTQLGSVTAPVVTLNDQGAGTSAFTATTRNFTGHCYLDGPLTVGGTTQAHNSAAMLQIVTPFSGDVCTHGMYLEMSGADLGDASVAYGFRCDYRTNKTCSSQFGVYIQSRIGATGAITNRRSLYIPAPIVTAGGTITNNYSIYLDDIGTAGSSLNYSIYSVGGDCSFNGNVGIGMGATVLQSKLHIGGSISRASWTANGPMSHVASATLTDNSSAASAVLSIRVANSYSIPTYASSNAITLTDATNVYVAGAAAAGTNTTITRAWAFHVAAGNSYFNSPVLMGTLGALSGKAILELSSTTLGFLPTRMTTTQRDAISAPPEGLMIYNTTTHKLNVFTTAWEQVTSA